MSQNDSFQITLPGRILHGTLQRPDTPDKTGIKQLPAILICAPPDLTEATADLLQSLVQELVQQGLATLMYEVKSVEPAPETNGSPGNDAVDNASAAFRWLALHDGIDLTRLGVIGFGDGAVIASCLSRRTDQIAGICLIAPRAKVSTAANGARDSSRTNGDSAPLQPIENVSHFDRPTMVLLAGADEAAAFADSQAYLTAMENVQHQVEQLIIARADHWFTDEAMRAICRQQLVRFFSNMPALAHAEQNL